MIDPQTLAVDILFGCLLLLGYQKIWGQSTYKPKTTVAVFDANNQINFLLDRYNQLVIQADDIDGEARICAGTTEELAVLLLPVARRVLKENGVVECN